MTPGKTYHFDAFELRINWLIAVCVLITAVTFISLGLWQLGRADEKVQAQHALESELLNNAEPIESIPAGHLHRANPELANRHVRLRGEYINDRTVLILAEFFDGQIGYGVVTPLRLATTGGLVLVHHGWTSGILPVGAPPELRPVAGPVDISAQIFVPPANARILPSEVKPGQWPLRLRSLETDRVAGILGEPVFPFEVRIAAGQAGTLVRHWPAVNPDINQHLFYALQWFAFAFIVLVVAVLAGSNIRALLGGSGHP